MATREVENGTSKIGLREWFRVGAHEHVEQVLAAMHLLGITELRAFISSATWNTPAGLKWYRWLLPRLTQEVNVLPCIVYTPASSHFPPQTPMSSAAPKNYGDFVAAFIAELGEYVEWIELRHDPHWISEWDWTLSSQESLFCEMMGVAAYRSRQQAKKTVLSGLSHFNPQVLQFLVELGVIDYVDAIGLNGYPGAARPGGEDWPAISARIRGLLNQFGLNVELWITDAGFPTRQHDEVGQMRAFLKALDAPVERVYWASLYDLNPNLLPVNNSNVDEHEYHLGLKYLDGMPKLLYRLWAMGGIEAIKDTVKLATRPSSPKNRAKEVTLITGGAGFIGSNLAGRLLAAGQHVLIFDNLSRPGVEQNLRRLHHQFDQRLEIEIADVRNVSALQKAVRRARQVYHLAAQVTPTNSLRSPLHDFNVNAQGTLNLLEALRALPDPPPLIFTSTHKVYGELDEIALRATDRRYEPVGQGEKANCIGENTLLDFRGPYACSKGTADQYVLDYARTFALPAVVLRLSSIYGPHQSGTEDQGWVTHFLIKTLANQPITVYGDGKQVCDILFANDLIEAFLLAQKNIASLSGQAFNIGGGPDNTISVLELVELIGRIHGQPPRLYFEQWRLEDQRYYVSDITKFQAVTGWQPRVSVSVGVEKLHQRLLRSRYIPLPSPLALQVVGA